MTKIPQSSGFFTRTSTYLLLSLCAFLVMLPNLGLHEFKNEESLRTIVAYEMQANADYVQPTYLGDAYFKKPPMYTWLTLASAQLTGWNELAVRIPSVTAYILTCLLLFFFVRRITGRRKLAALASLLYATTFEVLFFYGYVGEIDGTFTFAVFATIASLVVAFEKQRYAWLIVAGLMASFAFMLKGFPAFVFYGASLLILFFRYKAYPLLKSPMLYVSMLLCVSLPAIWLLNNADPLASFSTLFVESANRTRESLDIPALIRHLAGFPLEMLVKFLPGSVFLLLPLLLLIWKKDNRYWQHANETLPAFIKLLLLLGLINFIPYWISVGARIRYVLPLLPLLSIVAAYFFLLYASPLLQKRFLQVVIGIIGLRLLLGIAVIPLVMANKDVSNSDKAVAMDLLDTVDLQDKAVACNCVQRKAVCLYIDIAQQRVLKKSHLTPGWELLISCEKEPDLSLVKEYPVKKHPVLLYKKPDSTQ